MEQIECDIYYSMVQYAARPTLRAVLTLLYLHLKHTFDLVLMPD